MNVQSLTIGDITKLSTGMVLKVTHLIPSNEKLIIAGKFNDEMQLVAVDANSYCEVLNWE